MDGDVRRGGIGGQKLELVVMDDGFDPQRAAHFVPRNHPAHRRRNHDVDRRPHLCRQKRDQRIGVAIGKHQQDPFFIHPDQLEHSNGAAFGGQPRTPLPLAQGQGGEGTGSGSGVGAGSGPGAGDGPPRARPTAR